jgi:hypothetical protein
MIEWQEGVAVLIATFSAIFVFLDFIQPFVKRSGCSSCGGCGGGKQDRLKIHPAGK